MKKFLVIISLAAGFSSCKKFLEETPKGSITPVSFYKTASDLDMASTALSLRLNAAFNQIGSLIYGADDITVARAGNKISFSDFDTYQGNSSNDRMTNWWNSFYGTIKSANSLIQNYGNATAATEQQRNAAGGHAYFMRAISYFFLTRVWGEVPMPIEAIVDNNRPNATPKEIYALIVADLQKAETMLPDRWDGIKRQNGIDVLPTKGSAKALLASVYLTMAGWPLKETDKYALAAAKAKEVIDNKATWGYALEDINKLWKISNKYNHEAVFACYYNNDIPIYTFENGNMMGPPCLAPDEEGGWSDGFGELSFYNRFPAGPRKDATYQSVYYLGNDPSKPVDYTGLLRKHPYFFKFRDDDSFSPVGNKFTDWFGSATAFVIRYADVLLTYAEAKAMSSSADATAYAAINEVRTRAGLPNLAEGMPQQVFRDSVVAERGWEFAGAEPASRWFDLLRTETVAKANSLRDPAEEKLVGQPNDVSHAFYWAPLPLVK
jgi:hypothetical protein